MPQRVAPLPRPAILHINQQHPQFVDSPQRQSYSRVHSVSTEYLGNTERRGWDETSIEVCSSAVGNMSKQSKTGFAVLLAVSTLGLLATTTVQASTVTVGSPLTASFTPREVPWPCHGGQLGLARVRCERDLSDNGNDRALAACRRFRHRFPPAGVGSAGRKLLHRRPFEQSRELQRKWSLDFYDQPAD